MNFRAAAIAHSSRRRNLGILAPLPFALSRALRRKAPPHPRSEEDRGPGDADPRGVTFSRGFLPDTSLPRISPCSYEIPRNGAVPFAMANFAAAFPGAQGCAQQERLARA